jgi:hypothetical protein
VFGVTFFSVFILLGFRMDSNKAFLPVEAGGKLAADFIGGGGGGAAEGGGGGGALGAAAAAV